MHIVMIGSGYVGLVTAACLAEFGFNITCVDRDNNKISMLQKGICPIYEPGLEEKVQTHQRSGLLKFSTDLSVVSSADVVFIAVGTPRDEITGAVDTTDVFMAATAIAPYLSNYTVVVTKSTVPVGTARKIHSIVEKGLPSSSSFSMVSNPEFLREGSALDDFMRPDRVVVGVEDERAREVMLAVYRPLYLSETPIVFCGFESAELSKYAANAFLATKVAFVNEIANLADKTGADIKSVCKSMGLDRRIGSKFLHPGPGYGGSCFPKDTRGLVHIAKEFTSPMSIVETVVQSNERHKEKMVDKIMNALPKGARSVSILGLTFKPNTDDMRESPSLVIVPGLQSKGLRVNVHDPMIDRIPRELFSEDTTWHDSVLSACQDSSAVIILTEWNHYRVLPFNKMREVVSHPLLIDLRNIYTVEEVSSYGFKYECLGGLYKLPMVAEKIRS